MNRRANPNRVEHRRLTIEANAAAGVGDYAKANRLMRVAAQLKGQGQDMIDNSCCDGTGFADHASVPCPNPQCPVIARLSAEAEAGYDLDRLKPREKR